MTTSVLAQLAALKGLPTQDLKRRWRELFESEPPPYNRRFLESRLAYRIQELTYGGLKPETVERLDALAAVLTTVVASTIAGVPSMIAPSPAPGSFASGRESSTA